MDFVKQAPRIMMGYEDAYARGLQRVHVHAFIGDESILKLP